MLFKDLIRIAFRNIAAGSKMSKKIVYGMTILFMLLFCSLVVVNSYKDYVKEYNQKNIRDCYYFTEFQCEDVTETWVEDILSYSQKEKEQYNAKAVSVLASLQLKENEEGLWAQNVKLSLEKNDYSAQNYFVYKRKPYQNIYGETGPIEFIWYTDEMYLFAENVVGQSDKDYLTGRYPSNPGEIMLDTYLLSVFGITDATIGEKVSICSTSEQGDEVIVEEYILTGILKEEILTERESMDMNDYHLEHIYINPREEDLEQFEITCGSIRYYFNDYEEYVTNYSQVQELLMGDIASVFSEDSQNLRLTQNGLKFCMAYWLMHNIGKILLLIVGIIAIINTFSIYYIFQFYKDRNEEYLLMLQNIGMKKNDRRWIYFIEIFSMMVIATVLGGYLTTLILILFNSIAEQVIGFSLVVNLKSVLLSLFLVWIYFGLMLLLVMRRRQSMEMCNVI